MEKINGKWEYPKLTEERRKYLNSELRAIGKRSSVAHRELMWHFYKDNGLLD